MRPKVGKELKRQELKFNVASKGPMKGEPSQKQYRGHALLSSKSSSMERIERIEHVGSMLVIRKI
jgi:hypothetical protein